MCSSMSNVPSRFPHQSPNCPPLNSSKLSCLKVGKRLLETQAEFIVSLKKWSERGKKTICFRKNV